MHETYVYSLGLWFKNIRSAPSTTVASLRIIPVSNYDLYCHPSVVFKIKFPLLNLTRVFYYLTSSALFHFRPYSCLIITHISSIGHSKLKHLSRAALPFLSRHCLLRATISYSHYGRQQDWKAIICWNIHPPVIGSFKLTHRWRHGA